MAKKVKQAVKSEADCSCGHSSCGWVVLGCLVMGLALYLVVQGAKLQWETDSYWSIAVYGLGFLVWCVAKKLKWKAVGNCSACKM